MALHFEGHSPAVTDIDDASILFTRFYQDTGACSRKFSELSARILLGTMFAPHDGEHA